MFPLLYPRSGSDVALSSDDVVAADDEDDSTGTNDRMSEWTIDLVDFHPS